MPKMLNDGAVEYEDGTPATEAQVGGPFYIANRFLGTASICLILTFGILTFNLFYLISADGKRHRVIFILGCRTGNGRKETGKQPLNLSKV